MSNTTIGTSNVPTTAMICPPSIDKSFGPYAGYYCRGGFDFTLLFEQSILVIPLQCIFLILCCARLWRLSLQPKKVYTTFHRYAKTIASVALVGLQLAFLIKWTKTPETQMRHTRATIPAAALSFCASVGVAGLSWYEHARSVHPSFLLEIYLALSILLDSAYIRTLWLLREDRVLPILLTTSAALRALMVVLESTEKRSELIEEGRGYSRESTSGAFSRGGFFWLTSLFLKGYQKTLNMDDLHPLDKGLYATKLQRELEAVWEKVPDKKKPLALMGAWMSAQKWSILSAVIPKLALIGFTFSQPFLVQQGIILAAMPKVQFIDNFGYGLIGAYILVYVGIAISTSQYEHRAYRASIQMRGAVIPMIYRKTLRLNSSDANPAAALTLISTDIEVITQGIVQMHDVWATLVEIGLATWLLARQVKQAAAVPVGFAFLSIILTGFVAVPTGKAQAAWIKASQDRVANTANTIGGVKWLRLSGMNDAAFRIIKELRIHELKISRRFRIFIIWALELSSAVPILNPVLTFMTFALMALHGNETLTISRAFVSMSLFTLLHRPLSLIIIVLPTLAGCMNSFIRIQEYLNKEERVDNRSCTIGRSMHTSMEKGGASDVSTEGRSTDVEDVELLEHMGKTSSLPSASLVASIQGQLTWPEASKPALDVQNLEIEKDIFTLVLGPVGCGKSTLLKCLLGEVPQFEGAIHTWFNGVALCEQSPWLPNTTVRDLVTAEVGYDQSRFQQVVRACALEEDLRQWPEGESSVVGSKGITLSGGQKQRLSLARAVYSLKTFIILDDVFSGLDARTEDQVFHNLLGREGMLRNTNRTVLVTSSSVQRAPYADRVIVLGKDGRVVAAGTFDELNTHDGPLVQFSLNSAVWTEKEDTDGKPTKECTVKGLEDSAAELKPLLQVQSDDHRRKGDTSVYWYYVKSAGVTPTLIFLLAMAFYAFCEAFPSLWLKWWAEDNLKYHNSYLGKWLGVYAALAVGCIIALLIGSWELLVVIITKSGLYFHDLLLKTVSQATMSLFTTVDNGITVNRFSQDLQLIDMELPIAAIGVASSLAACIAQMVMMSIASKWLAVSIPPLIAVLYAIQHFYLRTSRQLRFLDIEYKAPLYSQIMETLSGLATIRAFGRESEEIETNIKRLNDSQRPAYLLNSVQRWLVLAIDMVVAMISIILIVITVTLREQIGAGYMAIALVNIVAFGATMKALIQSWVTMEISIGAVARIKNFVADTKLEEDRDTPHSPPHGWPSKGHVEIQNLDASYNSSGRVLKNISLTINAGEKVAIVGRTGSGKSSLILSLFRMMESTSGSIKIDNIDIHDISSDQVRAKLVGVPQESFVLQATVRRNVDPAEHSSDEDIIAALERVQLWPTIRDRGGLDALMDDKFLSHGQFQLLCLARAMVRPGKVLVLDEATSTLDENTRRIIDEAISSWFSDRTVIAIVHKLDTVLETYDRVAVLDEGYLVEYDAPRTLLQRQASHFKMLFEMGRGTTGTTGDVAGEGQREALPGVPDLRIETSRRVLREQSSSTTFDLETPIVVHDVEYEE